MNKPTSKSIFLIIAGLLLIWLYIPAGAAAGSYYVSPTGSDNNPGTESQPWRTVEKAAESAQAGDTIYFMEGVYRGMLRPQHSGAEGNSITFTSYPGHVATIDGGKTSKGTYGGVVEIHNQSHIVLSNLRIVNGGHYGIQVSKSDHILIQGNVTDFTFSSGIYLSDSREVIIDDNEVRRACHGVGGRSPQEHITVRNGVDGFEIRNNTVHMLHNGNGKEGINIKEGTANGKVYNNVVDGMRRTGLYIDAYDAYVNDVEVFGNVVTNSLHGIVVASERRGTVDNVAIYNNVFHNNDNNGVWVTHYLEGGPMTDISIVNNTIYNNANRGISITNPEASNVSVRNNIVLNNGEAEIYIDPDVPTVIADHNMLKGDASFLNPQAGDFRLQPDSPAVDAGTASDAPPIDAAGNRRPHGSAPDLGAFELTAGETPQQSQSVELFLPLLNR